jgi:hypothetical protein
VRLISLLQVSRRGLDVTGGHDITHSDEILYLGSSASKFFHDWVNDRERPGVWGE